MNQKPPYRLAFMGTPPFAAQALAALIEAGHEIICVYSQPPRPAGRGKMLKKSAVHMLAEHHKIEVRTPVSLKDSAEQAAFGALNLDVAVVAAYGLILPKAILDAPHYGCLNIHASLLPRWRGAAPIERAILNGDARTGISIMQMEAGLDTGPVLAKSETAIGLQDTAGTVHDRLANMGARLILSALHDLPGLNPQAQDARHVTYAAKIDKAEARIAFNVPALQVLRHIAAFNPRPGAFIEVNGERIRILKAELIAGTGGQPGEILDKEFTIACATQAIRPILMQRAGKAVMERTELLRGFTVPKGTQLH